MEQLLNEYREYFQNLTREEMKDLLEEAGFDVQDGSGKINFLEDSPNFAVKEFTVKGTFKATSSSINTGLSYSFPKAS